jgi:uncharacterized DUF497 family protein
MKAIWDEDKNRENIRKHKISFPYAVPVFNDPRALTYYDEVHSRYEDRYILIGFNGRTVLFISFTEPDSETYRLISARKATKHEQEEYNG